MYVQGGIVVVNKATKIKWYLERILGPIRMVAREHGYAVAVHGSLVRDIDLIAAPWVEECSSQKVVAEAIRETAAKILGYAIGPSSHDVKMEGDALKHHGRRCFSYYLPGPEGIYIDLSVMAPCPEARQRMDNEIRQRARDQEFYRRSMVLITKMAW